MTDRSLLLVTLGPVQEFIAAGRRTADLWAGSGLLSHLAAKAVAAVQDEAGPKAFLFPVREGGKDDDKSLPNRFLIEVDTARAAELARLAEDAARDELRRIAKHGLDKVGIGQSHVRAVEDVAGFLEVAWASVPLSDALDGHLTDWKADDRVAKSYRLVEMLGGARKTLRDFPGAGAGETLEGWPDGEPGVRCTLMPQLPALTEKSGQTPAEVGTWWKKLAARSGGRIRESERLSAVALAKRFFPQYVMQHTGRQPDEDEAFEPFPSTSSFAAADFYRDVLASKDPGVREAARAFDAAADALPGPVAKRYREAPTPGAGPAPGRRYALSGRLVAGDPLDAQTVKRETGYDHLKDADLRDFNRARADFLRAAAAAGIAPPSRYYGVLVLDGDKMGEWLSGARGDGAFPGTSGAERHREISRRLRTFAADRVPEIVETRHAGRLVYGGGDDVVALFSFRCALPAAREIYATFREAFHADATASAGLVFAHHLTPLQQVLGAARRAEKAAKNGGRDRLTITALKRSGDPAEVTLPWRHLEPLERFAGHIRRGEVSTGYAYDLAEALRLFRGPDHHENGELQPAAVPADLSDAFRAEARRLFLRRVERIEKDQRTAAFEATVGTLLSELPPDAAVSALQVAQFLGKGGDR